MPGGTAITKEKKETLKKQFKRARTGYEALKKHLEQDTLETNETKNEQYKVFLSLFENAFKEVKDQGWQSNFSDFQKLEEIYDTYVGQQNTSNTSGQSSTTGQNALNQIHDLAFQRDKMDPLQTEENLNRNVTESQIEGVREIEKWMYRNANHKGLAVWQSSKLRFVYHIAKLPIRMKLLMFYLIENQKRNNPDYGDVLLSQTTYTPNLKQFKEQMIATKGKIYKRLSGDEIYWNKIEDTLVIAKQCMPVLAQYGGLDFNSVDTEHLPKVWKDPSQQTTQQNNQQSGSSPSISQLLDNRKNKLKDFFLAVGAMQTSFNITTQQAVKTAYEQLLDADKQFSFEELNSPYKKPGMGEVVQDSVEWTAENTTQMMDYAGITGNVVDYNKAFRWGIPDLHTDRMGKAATVFSSVSAITQFAGALLAAITYAESQTKMNLGEQIDTVSNLIVSFADSIGNGVNSGYNIADWLGKASESTINRVGGSVSIVSGALHLGKGIYSMGKAGYQTYQKHQVYEDMDDVEKENVKGIMKVCSGLTSSQVLGGALESIAGGLQLAGGILTLSGVGIVAGAALTIVGTIVNLASTILKYVHKCRKRDKAIDVYLDTDSMLQAVKNHYPEGQKPEDDIIRKQVRNEMIAILGFASPDSFYSHITLKYAKFLYDHAFFEGVPNDRERTTEPKIQKKDDDSHINHYAKLIRDCLGFKLFYPEQNSSDKPLPEIGQIAEKMAL